ncbi:glycoside hydrolase family 99-like domain-containing protein [uncultured Lutibacter sp.]|uniref:glycosyltransferase WbsX family protein n=1 Tax=uncultured Lutibacter sp. TaxID=437739 RepID=UPI0026378FFF|nr:glycoside hydrolase family 99-like domain-containing protein [uncultured Lutibacter sp.]
MKIRPIAFVLPQFHPIPENDIWWGKGFTEWTNVTKSTPLFKGHYQPQLPTDLGFYDLRLPAAREAQANLAKEHGIHGFCYYHYWFNGKRLLNEPIDEMLTLQNPKMPFMLCWANENWTRRWDGQEKDILIKQEYSFDDDKEHMRWLCKNVFSDERYILVDGCPVFVVYRQDLFPNIVETAKIWRDIAINEFGFKDLYLCVVESFNKSVDPTFINFNAAIEFSPHEVIKNRINKRGKVKLLEKLGLKDKREYSLRDFKKGVENCINKVLPSYKLYRGVTPSWDNTARKNKKGTIAVGSSPQLYFNWLSSIVKSFKPYSKEENFIFINAMNEWAEGNHLEPCIKYKDAYLKATKKALDNN